MPKIYTCRTCGSCFEFEIPSPLEGLCKENRTCICYQCSQDHKEHEAQSLKKWEGIKWSETSFVKTELQPNEDLRVISSREKK